MKVMARIVDVKILREARIDDGLLVIADCASDVVKCGYHTECYFKGASHCPKGLVARIQARMKLPTPCSCVAEAANQN